MIQLDIQIVSISEAKRRFHQLLRKVESGEEITITRRGIPVARIVPLNNASSPDRRRAAIQHWLETSKGHSLGGLKIRDLINEGRR